MDDEKREYEIIISMNQHNEDIRDLEPEWLEMLTFLVNDALFHGIGCDYGILYLNAYHDDFSKDDVELIRGKMRGVSVDFEKGDIDDGDDWRCASLGVVVGTHVTPDYILFRFNEQLFECFSEEYAYEPQGLWGAGKTRPQLPLSSSQVVELIVNSTRKIFDWED